MYETTFGSTPFNAVYGTLTDVVTLSEVLENVMYVTVSNLLNLPAVVATKPKLVL